MSDSVITALITGAITLVVCLINNRSQMNKVVAALDKNNALFVYRVEQLEKKVDKHNNVVERMFKVESDLKTAFVKIDELKEECKEMKHHDS